jgi:tetratricopeptide (TPR) repeat protein
MLRNLKSCLSSNHNKILCYYPFEYSQLLVRVLAINERHYGPDHPEVATTLVNLGNAYESLGDSQKSRELLERALIIKERHYGPDHPEVATTLANLGNAYESLGDSQKSRELLERALTIDERHYGPDHPEVAKETKNSREKTRRKT